MTCRPIPKICHIVLYHQNIHISFSISPTVRESSNNESVNYVVKSFFVNQAGFVNKLHVTIEILWVLRGMHLHATLFSTPWSYFMEIMQCSLQIMTLVLYSFTCFVILENISNGPFHS